MSLDMVMDEVVDSTFEAEVLQRSRQGAVIALVLWSSVDGSDPSQALSDSQVKALKDQPESVFSIDVTRNPRVAATFGMEGLPAVYVISEGRVLDRVLQAPAEISATGPVAASPSPAESTPVAESTPAPASMAAVEVVVAPTPAVVEEVEEVTALVVTSASATQQAVHPSAGSSAQSVARQSSPRRSSKVPQSVKPTIQIKNLVKRWGTNVAVDDISFDVLPGYVTGFLGPNGAGKTTTLRMLLGISKPTSGEALIHGLRYQELKNPLREVGAVVNVEGIYAHRSARDHLAILALYNSISKSRIDDVLQLVGLEHVGNRQIADFSLGMRQRLGIAAAMLGDPPVLVLDEPVNGLDPEGVLWIRELMKSLAAEGRTVLVSSHMLNEMAVTATRVIVVAKGRVVANEPVNALLDDVSGCRVRVVGKLTREFIPNVIALGGRVNCVVNGSAALVEGLSSEKIGKAAYATGTILYQLIPERLTLEEAFLSLTSGRAEIGGGK